MTEQKPVKDDLDKAIEDYEGNSLFEAINYRQLRKNASMKARIEAAKADLRWFRDHSSSVALALDKAIGQAGLEINQ